MPARPFTPSEILTLESHLIKHGRFRDCAILVDGVQVGYCITELLT
jgi:hypothetical protein